MSREKNKNNQGMQRMLLQVKRKKNQKIKLIKTDAIWVQILELSDISDYA